MPMQRRAMPFAAAFGLVTAFATSHVVAQQQEPGRTPPPAAQAAPPEDAAPAAQGRDLRERSRRDWRDQDDDLDRGPPRGGRDFGSSRGRRGYEDDDWGERGRERWGRPGGDRGGDRGGGERQRDGAMGPGMMGGGGMMRPIMSRGLCGPGGGRMIGVMLDRLERVTAPSEGQRPLFDRLKEAAARAVEIARASCPTERPVTPPGRLAAAEKRLEALLQAIRTVRPAMDEFYASLSEEQKARLYAAAAMHRAWAGGWRDGGRGDERSDEWRRERGESWRGRGPDRGAGERWRDGDRGYERDRGRGGDYGRDRGRDYEGDDRRGYGGGRDYDRDGWLDPWRGRM